MQQVQNLEEFYLTENASNHQMQKNSSISEHLRFDQYMSGYLIFNTIRERQTGKPFGKFVLLSPLAHAEGPQIWPNAAAWVWTLLEAHANMSRYQKPDLAIAFSEELTRHPTDLDKIEWWERGCKRCNRKNTRTNVIIWIKLLQPSCTFCSVTYVFILKRSNNSKQCDLERVNRHSEFRLP